MEPQAHGHCGRPGITPLNPEANGSESFAHQNPMNLMAFHVLHNWIVMGTPPLAYTVQQQPLLEVDGEGP